MVEVGTHHMPALMATSGKHDYSFKNLTQHDKDMIDARNVKVFVFCDNIGHLLPDLLMTAGLFVGGLGIVNSPSVPFFGLQPTYFQKKWNREFMKLGIDYDYKDRNGKKNITPREQVQSGDYFAVLRLDGLDQIIGYGTGSMSGHSVEAVWDHRDGKSDLYICESQDSWYWPHGKGLQCNIYEDWMQWAQNAGFNVAHLPLSKEVAARFDEEKAWKWIDSVKGMPYGYRNFLFSWIDTEDKNFPPLMDIEFFMSGFIMLEKLLPGTADVLVKEALNHRVGKEGLTIEDAIIEGHKQGKTMKQLLAMPEIDGTMYSDG